jgi:hypothetical protein
MSANTQNEPPPKILDLPIGTGKMGQRVELDSLGTVQVPAEHYWGAQTQRSLPQARRWVLAQLVLTIPCPSCRALIVLPTWAVQGGPTRVPV